MMSELSDYERSKADALAVLDGGITWLLNAPFNEGSGLIAVKDLKRITEKALGKLRAERARVAALAPHTVARERREAAMSALNEVDELKERLELRPCPECDGEGGGIQRMGIDGATEEYCECPFCDDRLELTEDEIEARKLKWELEASELNVFASDRELERVKRELASLKKEVDKLIEWGDLAKCAVPYCGALLPEGAGYFCEDGRRLCLECVEKDVPAEDDDEVQ